VVAVVALVRLVAQMVRATGEMGPPTVTRDRLLLAVVAVLGMRELLATEVAALAEGVLGQPILAAAAALMLTRVPLVQVAQVSS
jgi:hypothetical protein